jgi:MFS family permease
VPPASRLAVAFACAGHFLHHVLTGLFLTLAVVLEASWRLPYDEVIALWTWGALLIGLGAPAAGWLADRLGNAPMMAVFFLGTGGATVAAGLVAGPSGMAVALAALGVFGAIYHPVGLSWVARAAPPATRGRVMGLLGISGSLGVAGAALVAGGLASLAGWRAALVVPGLAGIAAGLALVVAILRGRVADAPDAGTAASAVAPTAPEARAPLAVLVVLAVTFCLGSLLYSAFSTAAPKWISEALSLDGAAQSARLGLLVALVFLTGGLGQLLGGALADRWPLKWLYVLTFLCKLPLLAAASIVGGPPAVAVAALVVLMLDLAAPVENLLLAQYSSGRRRGLAFGLKFAMGFAAAPLGVKLVAALWEEGDGGFGPFFLVLAGLAAVMLVAALFLPDGEARGRPAGALAPAGAD